MLLGCRSALDKYPLQPCFGVVFSDELEACVNSDENLFHSEEALSEWEVALAVFVEMMCELQDYSTYGIQLGSVLFCHQQVHGRPKTLAMLKEIRQSLHKGGGEIGEVERSQVEKLQSFKVLATAPGVLAFEKPAGIETENALRLVASELGRPVTSTSRLDQPTSGIIPVAWGDECSGPANWFRAQWAGRLVSKAYVCLCSGHFDVSRGDISLALRQSVDNSMLMEVSSEGRPSRTTYTVLASYTAPDGAPISLVRAEPHTGASNCDWWAVNVCSLRFRFGRQNR